MEVYCRLQNAQMNFQAGNDNLLLSACLDNLADCFVFIAGKSVFFQNFSQVYHRLAENLMILLGDDTGDIELSGNFKQSRTAVDDLAWTFLNRGQVFLNVNNQQNRVVFIHKHHASPYLINYVFYVIRILLTKDKTCQFYKIIFKFFYLILTYEIYGIIKIKAN